MRISQQIQSLEAFKVSAEMGRSWQANWEIVIIFAKNQHNWRGFRPYLVTPWKEFEISLKNGVLKIFKRVNRPCQFSGPWLNTHSLECYEYVIARSAEIFWLLSLSYSIFRKSFPLKKVSEKFSFFRKKLFRKVPKIQNCSATGLAE